MFCNGINENKAREKYREEDICGWGNTVKSLWGACKGTNFQENIYKHPGRPTLLNIVIVIHINTNEKLVLLNNQIIYLVLAAYIL